MLKNYTSRIPARTSISFIEQKLAGSGARQILKTYDNEGRTQAISFVLRIDGTDIPIKLPARVSECEKVLEQNLSRRAKPETRKRVPAQAERTAWKILSDWVEAQIAMIELAQVEIMEVFLPYVYNVKTDQTFFEGIKSNGFEKLLPAGNDK